jgi:hypothetical protein
MSTVAMMLMFVAAAATVFAFVVRILRVSGLLTHLILLDRLMPHRV